MIEKMKVVHIVAAQTQKTELLDALRALGIVHFAEKADADQTYLERFASQRNTVFHMKELWSYLSRLFVGAEGKPLKRIRKAADSPAYEAAVDQMFSLPLREEAEWGPGAPL